MASASTTASPPTAAGSKFEKFSLVRVHRSQLLNAPYNPRQISDQAKQKLRENIRKVGLVEPIIWNQRSGNIVGGHQRVAALDALEETRDYSLTVAAVDLDAQTEKEQNIFLNNVNAQGDWDLDKLGAMFKDEHLTPEGTGFDLGELYQMFGESPFQESAEVLAAMGERVRAFREEYRKMQADCNRVSEQVNFYAVLVFESDAEREAFAKVLGVEDNKFVDGRTVKRLLEELAARKKAEAQHAGE